MGLGSKPSGVFVDRIACTKCSSSDAMAVYEQEDGSYNATCFSCGGYERDPYKEGKPVSRKEPYIEKYSIYDVAQFPSCDLTDRGLRKDTLDHFGVKVGLSESDGRTVTEHYYPIIDGDGVVGYKKRSVADKKFGGIGNCKSGKMFGQWQASRNTYKRKLFVTEGEIDAMTVYQVLKDKNQGTKWADFIPAVVSVTKGAQGADKELARHMEFINQYDQVVLLFDNDEAGKEGMEKAISVLPIDKVYTVKLAKKDPNEYLKAKQESELVKELSFNVVQYKPVTVVGVRDIITKALTPPTMGIPWLFPTLNYHTMGRKTGNLYGVGSGVGMGKSTLWFSQIADDAKKEQGKHGLFMFEESPEDSLLLLGSFIHGVQLHNPEVDIPYEEKEALLAKLDEHVYFCDHSDMVLGSKDSWQEIVQAIRHMAIVEECKHITLDPMSAMTAQMQASEANDFLNAAYAEMASLAKKLDICIYYGSHLNVPKFGKPHEEGGRVHESQFTGSRAAIKWSQYIFGIERDKQETDQMRANTSWIRLLKIRRKLRKEQCLFPAFYDVDKSTFLEVERSEVYGECPPSEKPKESPRSGLRSDQPYKEDARF